MQTELLKVIGMTCGGCTGTVTRALQAVTGVGEVNVSLSAGDATVQYDERLTSPEQLKSAVKGAGYGVDAVGTNQKPTSKGCCCGSRHLCTNCLFDGVALMATRISSVAPRLIAMEASCGGR